jgi:hypothetical protein
MNLFSDLGEICSDSLYEVVQCQENVPDMTVK